VARVLVVDDVKFISQMIAGVFQRMGHGVDTAADGEEALKKAFSLLPDLVVMDVAMPKIDGLEVARRLRANDRTRDVPILLVTSRADSGTLMAAVQAGVDDHLVKPFDSATLLSKAAVLLGGYPMSFSLELLGEIAVVTALPEELGAASAEHFAPAIQHARTAGASPVVADLSRVSRIDTQVGDAVLACAAEAKREGAAIEMVRPRNGVGVRAFLSMVSSHVRTHADLASARAAYGLPDDVVGVPIPLRRIPRGAVIPSDPGTPAPPALPATPGSVTRMGAARGVVVEVHPQATIFRVSRPELDSDVLTLLHEEVSRGPRALLLELGAVTELDAARANEVAALAEKAKAAGASLRFVNPAPGVEAGLEAAGLSALVLRTRARDAAPTRSSS
jgi:CheY-like chemotaxis protein